MSGNSMNNDRATGTSHIKLRASCNACHESKVRCTQSKPTCVRCERNGLVCVYGLSRRTHKDAPRILSPSRRSLSAGSRGLSTHQQQNRVKECPITPSMLEMPPIINFLEDHAVSAFNCTSETLVHSDILTITHDSGQDSLAGFPLPTDGPKNTAPASTWATGGVGDQLFGGRAEDGPWVGLDLEAPLLQVSPNLQEQNQHHLQPHQDQDQDQDMREAPPGHGEAECSCSSEAVPVLVRMSPLFNRRTNQRLPFDMELSQIKRAIMGCEASVSCQPHAADPNIAMIMGVLIGGIIEGFEKLLANDNQTSIDDNDPQSSSPTPEATKSANEQGQAVTKSSSGNLTGAEKDSMMTESRLSWGVLQLEDDDEADLRLRLCVLYFRRLETLLKHFGHSVRFLRDAEQVRAATLRNSAAQVMACDYMRIWLEQKAEIVRLSLSRRHAE